MSVEEFRHLKGFLPEESEHEQKKSEAKKMAQENESN